MLVTNLAQAFGQDTTDTPSPIVDPILVTTAGLLFDVESKLKQAFNQLQVLNAVAPNQTIDSRLISSYQTARADFVRAVEIWRQAYENTPAEDRFDPNAVPVFPPEITVTAAPTASLGSIVGPIAVPISQIAVTYGPIGNERTVPLGAALGDPDFHYWYTEYNGLSNSGLGAFPVVAFLIGLALTGTTVVLVVRALNEDRGRIEVARADAERQQAVAGLTLNAYQTLANLTAKCVGTSTDPAVQQRCVASATQSAIAVLQGAAPLVIAPSPSPGISAFGLFGIIIGVAAVAGGGYALYRYHSKNQ